MGQFARRLICSTALGVLTCAHPASAAASCVVDPASSIAAVTAQANAQTTIAVASGQLRVDGVACGALDALEQVRVTGSPGAELLTIDLAGGVLGPGASETDAPGSLPELEVVVDLAAGDDIVELRGSQLAVAGARGLAINRDADADVVLAGVERLLLTGTPRADQLLASGGAGTGASAVLPVTINGGAGNDLLVGGAAGDDLRGASGTDTVSYAARHSALSLSFDSRSNDGANGEGDRLRGDIERVIAGTASDTIDARRGAVQRIASGSGNDLVRVRNRRAQSVDCGRGARDRAISDDRDRIAWNCEGLLTRAGYRRAVAYATRRPGVVSFAIFDANGRQLAFHGDRQHYSASVIKAMLLTARLRQLGSHALPRRDRALLGRMIRVSANRPAHVMLDRVGRARVNSLARAADMRRFALAPRLFSALVTSRDQALYFRRIFELTPRRHRAYSRALLEGVAPAQSWGIPRVARAQGWRVFHKAGWRRGVTNQVARMERDGEVVTIAILTTTGEAQGRTTIEGVTRRLLG